MTSNARTKRLCSWKGKGPEEGECVFDVVLEGMAEGLMVKTTKGRKEEWENPDGGDFLMRRPHIFHQ